MNTQDNQYRQGRLSAYIIFTLAASFYLYEYILQVAPSVMAQTMMQTLQVNAASFGIASSLYFYAYAPMQLPAGILFDRYGPRRLITCAVLLCAFGAIFFASTNQLFTVGLGRILIGMGSAFSFIGIIVLISRWFPPKQFAILVGIAQMMSSLGAIFGEMPLASLVNLAGWRHASFILGVAGIFLALLIWFIVRDYPDASIKNTPKRHIADEWRRLHEVCRHSYTWIIGSYAFCIWTPISVFAALWGVPYLELKFNISVFTASGMCSMIWLGVGIGSPLLGWVSDYFYSRRLALGLSAALGLTASIFVLYVPDISIAAMYFLLFIFGLGSGGQTVSFAVVNENNPDELVGSASGFNNFAVLIGGAIFQPLVGVYLHHAGDWTVAGGVHMYSIATYNQALTVLPVCYLISLLIVLFFIRESHPLRAR